MSPGAALTPAGKRARRPPTTMAARTAPPSRRPLFDILMSLWPPRGTTAALALAWSGAGPPPAAPDKAASVSRHCKKARIAPPACRRRGCGNSGGGHPRQVGGVVVAHQTPPVVEAHPLRDSRVRGVEGDGPADQGQ